MAVAAKHNRLIAKNGTPSEIVLASFREIRGHYEANNNNKNE